MLRTINSRAMHEDDLELWSHSASAWIECQAGIGDESRQFLDPFVLSALGNLQNQKILDIGCGEGRFGRILKAQGASVVGLEPTPAFACHGTFATVAGIGEALPFQRESFDLVVFYLVLIDIENYASAIHEATRVLRPGGRLVAINLTPMSTSSREPFWIRDSQGAKLARKIEFYGIPQAHIYEWSGMRIRNYHRPLRDYMRAYLQAGLRLELYEEPMDSTTMADSVLCPNFDLMVWSK